LILNEKSSHTKYATFYKPKDIESINVLNDSAAGKYGEIGKNGVIIIKSKLK